MPNIPNTLALDPKNHDLYLDAAGQLAFHSTTEDLVGQKIKCRLQTVLGEWYQQPDVGVPFFDEVMVKNPNLVTIKHLFASVITSLPEVKSLDSLDLTFNAATRILNIKFSVTAYDGTTVIGSI